MIDFGWVRGIVARVELLLLVALWSLAAPATVAAQCANRWLPGSGIQDTDGEVVATVLWDADGPGPRAPVLVVGGNFTVAGEVAANCIATYDPTTGAWGALGEGLFGTLFDLVVLPTGELVAAGSFVSVAVPGIQNVARWDGATWSPLGSGTDAAVFSLTALPNGDLIAGGLFTHAGGVACNHIARWNGFAWSPLGAGTDQSVVATARLPNGHLVAGGFFQVAGAYPVDYCAEWTGSTWLPMGAGVNGYVWAFAVQPNGDVLAGGAFSQAGGAACDNVARWDGSAWSSLGAGLPFAVQKLRATASGAMLAVGYTQAVGAPVPLVSRWNGSTWTSFVGGPESGLVDSIAELPGGDLVAVGEFTIGGSSEQLHMSRWNGSSWSILHPGTVGNVAAVAPLPGGGCFAAGSFTEIDGVAAHHVARWDGAHWSPLGAGTNFPPRALLVLPNGDLVVGGNFTQAGGVIANGIARWNGSSWSTFGSGMNGFGVRALCLLPDGSLVAGGDFDIAGGVSANHIARWNGSTWSPMGSGMDDRVSALTLMTDGRLVAGGRFVRADLWWQANHVAFWDGTYWNPMGFGTALGTDGEVFALLADPAGGVVVGGDFGTAGGITSPNLVQWSYPYFQPLPTPAGPVYALHRLPDGDVVVGGAFEYASGPAGTYVVNRIARLDGNAWFAFGNGFANGTDGPVFALAGAANGELLVGGNFARLDHVVSKSFARVTTTCPAAVVSAGVGCSGPSGWNQLSATSLPWTGSTFRTRATGMPAGGLALAVTDTSAWLWPLPWLLPAALPGCQLLVWPNLMLDLYVPTANALDVAIAIPDTMALANVVLHQQVIAFDLSPAGDFTAITSSNALLLLLGTF